ncbi:DUF4397 domain-containing protein [Bacillus sp. M6-12]|uniref:DUF4397 domain-containing protein n=1 Tax=Bacillus sp. M6-12 TaxID=2054166 RepID=UPI0015E084AA|nr:DUF4397 domain-containing protein [Bacillus sp. M6-12]
MSRNTAIHFQKASMYYMLAEYHKYSNPELHVKYYYKHFNHLKKATQGFRSNAWLPQSFQTFPGRLRFLHACLDAPDADVYLNGMRIFQNAATMTAGEFLSLPEGQYQLDIYPSGKMIQTIVSGKVTITTGKLVTAAVAGHTDNPRLVVLTDDSYIPAGESKIRFVHLSPDAPSFDIAVKQGDIVFPNLSYRKATDYLGIMPMTIDLEVRMAGTSDVVLDLEQARFYPDKAYSIYLTGYAGKGPGIKPLILHP